MTFDPKKPVRTRAGKPARIICVDRKREAYSIVALVTHEGGGETIESFCGDGAFMPVAHDPSLDLVNIPERMSRWMNVYAGFGYASRDVCESARGEGCLAAIELIFEDGKPVDVKLRPVDD